MKTAIYTCLLLILCPLLVWGQLNRGEQKVSINGSVLHLQVIGTGKPLVVIHGGPGLNHSYFLPYLSPLAKTNRLVLYDQRACGQSAIPSPDSVTMDLLIRDIDEIRKKLGVSKINVLAHSWGCLLATRYGMMFPERVDKMILSNPTPLSHEYDKQMMEFVKTHTTRQDSIQRAKIYHSPSIEADNYEKLMRISFRASAYNRNLMDSIDFNLPDNYLESTQALMSGLQKDLTSYNYYGKVRNFKFRVLIIEGKYDGIPTESIERLNKSIPNSRVHRFEKSGHFPFVEEPGQFVKVVGDFLKKG